MELASGVFEGVRLGMGTLLLQILLCRTRHCCLGAIDGDGVLVHLDEHRVHLPLWEGRGSSGHVRIFSTETTVF